MPLPAFRPEYFVALFGVALLATACGGAGDPENGQQVPDPSTLGRAEAALNAAMSGPYGTEHQYVPAAELGCAEADFRDHLHVGDLASHRPFGPPSNGLVVKVAEVLSALNGVSVCEPVGQIERCVIVHVGLDSLSQFDVRLQFLCLTYDSATAEYAYPKSDDCYRIQSDSSLMMEPDGLLYWRASGGGWNLYEEHVVILSGTGATWAKIDGETEPNAGVYSESELRAVIEQNGIGDGLLSLVPIATPETRVLIAGDRYDEQGFHQGVAWMPMGIKLDDKEYPGAPYKNKALDVQTPCPSHCPEVAFRFWTKGTAPRSDCR